MVLACGLYLATHTQQEGILIGDRSSVTFDKVGITVVLNRLAQVQNGRARQLYGRLMSSWGMRPDRQRVTVKLNPLDLQLLQKLRLPGNTLALDVLPSQGWITTYQHPKNPNLEVTVRSKDKPPKRRIFSIGGKKRRLVAVQATHLDRSTNHKEATRMAKAKTKSRKAADEDELEGLEDLDDLEDLEDLDDEEPDDEEEVDEDEDEEPAPKRGRAKSKSTGKAASKGRSRKAAAEEDEDEEDEDEDEDEDEAPRRSKRGSAKSKTTAKSNSKASAKKGTAKKNGKGGGLPTTRELPKGRVGPEQIAEMVGGNCDARYVRIWLRDSEYEREDGSRWSFSKTDAKAIAKEIKADRREAGAK